MLFQRSSGSSAYVRSPSLVSRTPANCCRYARPRIGLYKSWVANIDEGWTRWLLERYEFPYVTLTNGDVRAGSLRARLDVIVLPDQSPRQILDGHQPSDRPSRPMPWNPPPPDRPGRHRGGWPGGARAVRERRRHARHPGRGQRSALSRFGGPFARITDVTAGLARTNDSTARDCCCAWPSTPRAPARSAWRRNRRRTSATRARSSPRIRRTSLARYAPAPRLLMSGWLLGAEQIADRHAALEVDATEPAVSSCLRSARSSGRSRMGRSSCCSTRSTDAAGPRASGFGLRA